MTTPHALVIDPHPDNALSLALLLRVNGWKAAVAHSGPAGLMLAVRDWPDVILTEIRLPDEDGFELVRRLARLCRRVAVVTTAAGAARHYAFAAGAIAYFLKPAEPAELLAWAGRKQTVQPPPGPGGGAKAIGPPAAAADSRDASGVDSR